MVEGGYVEPQRPLEFAGMQLWQAAMTTGGNWIARNSDTQLLLMVCEQMDRRTDLIAKIDETQEWRLYRALHDLEKMISTNLSMLGFTPADRTRLGLAEVKAMSKLDQLMERKANRVASPVANSSSSE
jgi:non-ribosomal peptide synthetase component E (peptide arylation enzyme)